MRTEAINQKRTERNRKPLQRRTRDEGAERFCRVLRASLYRHAAPQRAARHGL
jgi:hypothetical protein